MSGLKTVVRHGFTGGGVATLLLAGLFVVSGDFQDPVTLFLIGWLAAVGVVLVLAGTRERLRLGSQAVGWPRLAAVGIAILAVGCGGFGLSQLRNFAVASGPWLLTVAGTVFVLAYFAWFALECWAGGWQLDEEMFAVEV
jgi:hypothetical protein